MKKVSIALASLALFVGCASHSASSEGEKKDGVMPLAFEGQNLKIEKIVVDGKSFNSLGMEEKPNISFEKNKFYGLAGCNRFFGNYEKKELNLQVDGAASTQMLCHPKSVMEFESAFLTNFKGNFKILNEDGKIILDGNKIKIYLQ